MTLRGPVLTLLAVAALGAGFYLANVRATAQSEIAAQASATPVSSRQAAIPLAAPGVSLPLPSPGAPSAPPPAPDQQDEPPAHPAIAYAGRTSGNEITIAIVVQVNQVVAYLCDGKRLESWLTGPITNEQFTLQGGDGTTVTGAIQGDAAFGTVATQGKQWAFAAQHAELPAGLYQGQAIVNGAAARIGWIVLPDGTQVGVANVGGIRQPAPPLDPRRPGPVLLDGGEVVPRLVESADPAVG